MGIKEAISEAMSEEPSGDMGVLAFVLRHADSIEKSIVGAACRERSKRNHCDGCLLERLGTRSLWCP